MEQSSKSLAILRDLAKQVAEICGMEKQEQRRELWRKHNSLEKTKPPVVCRPVGAWRELLPADQFVSEDPVLRGIESDLRRRLFADPFEDDWVCEPWVAVGAAYIGPTGDERWGVKINRIPSGVVGGAWKYDPPIKDPVDLAKLVKPRHAIDEQATAERLAKAQDAVGDILDVVVDRSPALGAGLANQAAYLRGLEQFMWDMTDRPEWFHELMRFLMEAALAAHDEAERAGHLRLFNSSNQSQPYSLELPDPSAEDVPVQRSQLWYFTEAQEFAQVSPAMHDEFLLQYQMPILEPYGLVAYGCCEDLTHKLDILKQIPRLRRVGVTPWTDLATSVQKLGRDYVLSWRPNPTDMTCSFSPDRVRRITKEAMQIAGHCNIEVYLKDIETVEGHPENLREWTRITQEVVSDYA